MSATITSRSFEPAVSFRVTCRDVLGSPDAASHSARFASRSAVVARDPSNWNVTRDPRTRELAGGSGIASPRELITPVLRSRTNAARSPPKRRSSILDRCAAA